jgi:galactose mutarotase-like enzyme
MLQNQNDNGTILYFKHNDRDIIFPFTQFGDIYRGGMFWCIPNLGPEGSVFAMQNGEYRKTEGRDTKTLSGVWGSLVATVSYVFTDTTVVSTMFLRAAQHETKIRPGFHPYFPVGETFEIHIGETKLTKENIPSDTRVMVIVHEETPTATLITHGTSTTISYHIDTWTSAQPQTKAFCIWTDNKDKYLCVEPVFGSGMQNDGSPDATTLNEGDEVTVTATIHTTLLS